MASNVDATVPAAGNASTANVRANFSTIKTEIEALQDGSGIDSGAITPAKISNTWPAFLLTMESTVSNVTGDGTTYEIAYDNEVFDLGGDVSGHTFTAPVTGKYRLEAHVDISGVTTAATSFEIEIITSNNSFQSRENLSSPPSILSKSMSILADMDASDTAVARVRVVGEASDVVDLIGTVSRVRNWFSGSFVA